MPKDTLSWAAMTKLLVSNEAYSRTLSDCCLLLIGEVPTRVLMLFKISVVGWVSLVLGSLTAVACVR